MDALVFVLVDELGFVQGIVLIDALALVLVQVHCTFRIPRNTNPVDLCFGGYLHTMF